MFFRDKLTLYSSLTAWGSTAFRVDSREGNSSIRSRPTTKKQEQIHTAAWLTLNWKLQDVSVWHLFLYHFCLLLDQEVYRHLTLFPHLQIFPSVLSGPTFLKTGDEMHENTALSLTVFKHAEWFDPGLFQTLRDNKHSVQPRMWIAASYRHPFKAKVGGKGSICRH